MFSQMQQKSKIKYPSITFFFHISSYTCFIWILIQLFKENSNLFVFKRLSNIETVGHYQTLMHPSFTLKGFKNMVEIIRQPWHFTFTCPILGRFPLLFPAWVHRAEPQNMHWWTTNCQLPLNLNLISHKSASHS